MRTAIPAFIAAVALSAAAAAQDPRVDPRAMTVIGSDAHARRCGALVAGGDSTDATIEACTRALNYRRISREGQVQVLVNRGVTHMRRQQNDLAVADFDAVIGLDRENAEAHLNRGAALVQLQRYGPAISALTEALGLGVREPHKAYFNRGIARESLGDLRGAFEDYSTALDIYPDWGPASAELARFASDRRAHLATVLADPTP
ncbi:MAG: tetratricopeptide repeat protein [Phycisphaerales bacterium]|nr:tetratricopeptide repeat protein [Hyphomonadaceae bacterium]